MKTQGKWWIWTLNNYNTSRNFEVESASVRFDLCMLSPCAEHITPHSGTGRPGCFCSSWFCMVLQYFWIILEGPWSKAKLCDHDQHFHNEVPFSEKSDWIYLNVEKIPILKTIELHVCTLLKAVTANWKIRSQILAGSQEIVFEFRYFRYRLQSTRVNKFIGNWYYLM